jgi:hypothetical protein
MSTDRARVSAWRWFWFLFSLNSALFCLGAWTAAPFDHVMPCDATAIRSGQKFCSHYCGTDHSRSNTSCLDLPADPRPTMGHWVWAAPVDSESSDTGLALKKITISHGFCSSGTACAGDVSRCPMRISHRLYLRKKTLLC